MQNEAPILGWYPTALRAVVLLLKRPIDRLIGTPLPEGEPDIAALRLRAAKADIFFAALVALDAIAIAALARHASGIARIIALGFLSWRIVDIMATAVRIALFDREAPARTRRMTLEPGRVVTYGFMYFFESAACFGAIYSAFPELIGPSGRASFLDAMHLSFVTAFTIGYGDVVPLAGLRVVTWIQGGCSLMLLVLLVGRYVGALQASD